MFLLVCKNNLLLKQNSLTELFCAFLASVWCAVNIAQAEIFIHCICVSRIKSHHSIFLPVTIIVIFTRPWRLDYFFRNVCFVNVNNFGSHVNRCDLYSSCRTDPKRTSLRNLGTESMWVRIFFFNNSLYANFITF